MERKGGQQGIQFCWLLTLSPRVLSLCQFSQAMVTHDTIDGLGEASSGMHPLEP